MFFVKEFTGWLYELRLSCNFLVQCAFLSSHLCVSFFICSIMSCFKSQNFVLSFNYCSGSLMCLSYSQHLATKTRRSNGCLCLLFCFFMPDRDIPALQQHALLHNWKGLLCSYRLPLKHQTQVTREAGYWT